MGAAALPPPGGGGAAPAPGGGDSPGGTPFPSPAPPTPGPNSALLEKVRAISSIARQVLREHPAVQKQVEAINNAVGEIQASIIKQAGPGQSMAPPV